MPGQPTRQAPGRGAGPKRVELVAGAATVEAPANKPMEMTTPHARIRVLGTRFAVGVDATGTTVDLAAGRLYVGCLRDGQSVILEPDHIAVVTDSIRVTAKYATPAAQGLVGHWTFDETTPETALDSSGQGHHGRLHGAVRVPGVLGNALLFDGVAAYVDVGDPPALRFDGPMTVAAWVYCRRLCNGRIAARQGGHSARSWSLNIEETRHYSFQVADTAEHTIGVATPIPQLGVWVHLAGVYVPSRALRLYIDGRLQAQQTEGIPARQYVDAPHINIGRRPDAIANTHWDGMIDDVRLYNRELSDAEVAELFQAVGRRRGARSRPSDG